MLEICKAIDGILNYKELSIIYVVMQSYEVVKRADVSFTETTLLTVQYSSTRFKHQFNSALYKAHSSKCMWETNTNIKDKI